MSEDRGRRTGLVLTNAALLYAARAATLVLPLLTIPYLTRCLGVAVWGDVVFAQITGILLSLLIDFGFGWSATREVARWRHDPARLRRIVAGVLGLRLLLAGLVLSLGAALVLCFPALFWRHPLLTLSTLVFVLAQGFNMYWYHGGHERMAIPAVLDVASYAIYAGGIFALVHGPEDAWRVMALQGFGAAVATAGSMAAAARRTRLEWPGLADARQAFAMGRDAFLYRIAVGAQGYAGGFALGALASSGTLGLFAGPEKIIKAATSAIAVSSDVLFPRFSRLLHESQRDAALFSLLTSGVLLVGGCLAATVLGLAADWLLPLVLGEAFAAAAPIFRIVLWALPCICLTASLGPQWLLPLGGERALSAALCLGVLVNVGLMLLLVPHFGGTGAAWAMLASEAAIAATVVAILISRDTLPLQLWWRSRRPAVGEVFHG